MVKFTEQNHLSKKNTCICHNFLSEKQFISIKSGIAFFASSTTSSYGYSPFNITSQCNINWFKGLKQFNYGSA